MFINEKYVTIAQEEHFCPHCNQRLSCCHVPPFHVGDGLGWGTEVFFVCLNDECPMFVNSWQEFEEKYGHVASCRYMLLPGAQKGEAMMVGSKAAFTGCIIDPENLQSSSERHRKELENVKKLETCVAEADMQPVLELILDEEATVVNREKACELLDKIDDLSCIDPIRNHTFRHTEIGQLADLAISRLLKKNLKKECVYCSEIIKAQAKLCMHCGKESK